MTEALTWDDLANIYKNCTGRNARVRPMNEILEWAEKQTDKFCWSDEGTLHLMESETSDDDNEMQMDDDG